MIIYTDGNGKEYTAERNRIDDVAKRLCEGYTSELLDLYDAAHPEEVAVSTVTDVIAAREAAEAPFTFTGIGTNQRNVVWDSGSIRIIVDITATNDDTIYTLLNGTENPEEITLDGFWPD